MPITRSKRKNSTDTEIPTNGKMNGKMQKKGKAKEPNTQWVMVAPKNFVNNANAVGENPYICKLPHPKSGSPALYAFKEKSSYEILKFSDNYRSWFYNDSVQEDGSLYILSPIDPIFLAIPYLNRVAKKKKYMTLDQTFVDQEFQQGMTRLESCLSCNQLEELCDRKGPADLSAFQLNMEKLNSWLAQKVERLAEHLKTTNLHVGSGSQASNFVKSSHDNSYTHGEYMSYAFELVADYIDDEIKEKLKDHLKIVPSPQIKQTEEEEPPSKRQKMNGDLTNSGCLEDYRDKQSMKVEKKTAKLTAGQKQLAKVDKTGMKSLNNFFIKTPKK